MTGGVRSEFTVLREGPEAFYLVSSGAAERYDHDFLLRHVAGDGVRIENITTAHGVLVLAGPRARDILQAVTDSDLSNAAFPWLTAQPISIGVAPATAMRVNFVGELGWELHHPIEYQNRIFDALVDAGEQHGLGMCGMRAMDSLRIEKSYRMWGQDLTIEYSAFEAGLDRFIALDKGAVRGPRCADRPARGRRAAGLRHARGRRGRRRPLGQRADLRGRDHGGPAPPPAPSATRLVRVWRSAMSPVRHAEPGRALAVEILGERKPARLIPASPVDPDNEKLRA